MKQRRLNRLYAACHLAQTKGRVVLYYNGKFRLAEAPSLDKPEVMIRVDWLLELLYHIEADPK